MSCRYVARTLVRAAARLTVALCRWQVASAAGGAEVGRAVVAIAAVASAAGVRGVAIAAGERKSGHVRASDTSASKRKRAHVRERMSGSACTMII